MAKKGMKIKELATEFGVTSRQLIDRCRAEGMQVQNSITKLTPREVGRVRTWFLSRNRGTTTERADCAGG